MATRKGKTQAKKRTRRASGKMSLQAATKLLTLAPSFKAFVDSIHEDYTPTIRLSNYKGKSRKAAKMLRAALHKRGIDVYPAYSADE